MVTCLPDMFDVHAALKLRRCGRGALRQQTRVAAKGAGAGDRGGSCIATGRQSWPGTGSAYGLLMDFREQCKQSTPNGSIKGAHICNILQNYLSKGGGPFRIFYVHNCTAQ